MPKIYFRADEVKSLYDHSFAAKDHIPTPDGDKPGLILIFNEGLYLVSNGLPRQLADPKADPKDAKAKSKYAYAYKCSPTNPDYYDSAMSLVGRDHVAKLLPLDMFAKIIEGNYNVLALSTPSLGSQNFSLFGSVMPIRQFNEMFPKKKARRSVTA